jgi:hypothetical protein
MSRTYRFVRVDADEPATAEVTLRCPNDDDALLIAGRLGRRVEVWQGERRVGVVVGGEETGPVDLTPETPAGAPPPEAPRAFNPFRPEAWRRVRR